VLIEREPEYQQDIAKRMDLVMAGPDEKRHAIIKRKGRVEAAGPLFAGWEAAE
jgi:site-specific DNA-methyltransferase (adenine-specific)